MAFLHIDKRGFFYLCESRRKGARVARVKLAYLGRMIVPVAWDTIMGTTDGPNAAIVRNGELQKLCNRLFRVWLGKDKPTFELACFYCRIVAGMVSNWKKRDAKIIARAAKALKIIQEMQRVKAKAAKNRLGKAGKK